MPEVGEDGWVRFWKLVVPGKMQVRLMQEVHDNVASGHLGISKTLGRLRQIFFWFGMDVQECRTCTICIAKKGSVRNEKVPLQIYQIGAPMERIAGDMIGPFPVNESGNHFTLVPMDYFTKWPEAMKVAEVLVGSFELHSDQGREFESVVFQKCCRLMGIRKMHIALLRPQSDGMVEHFNCTIVQELFKYCMEGQREWNHKFPLLLMVYRSAKHEAITYIPVRLMLGRELKLPVDVVTRRPPDEELLAETTKYAISVRRRFEEVHHQVRDQLKFAEETMRCHYNRNAHASNFQEDLV